MLAAPVFADDLQQDLKARRARAMEKMAPESMLVLFSAPAARLLDRRRLRIPAGQRSLLLHRDRATRHDPGAHARQPHEQGIPVRAPAGCPPRTLDGTHADHRGSGGPERHRESPHVGPASRAFSPRRFGPAAGDAAEARDLSEFGTFLTAVRSGRARVGLILSPQPALSAPLGPAHEFARSIRDRFIGRHGHEHGRSRLGIAAGQDARTSRRVLRRSVEISSEAHRAGMRAARPGVFEYEVESAIEAVYLKNGAMSWGYPSIVGSGPNATILHYSESSRKMEEGDLLLVDAAGQLSAPDRRHHPHLPSRAGRSVRCSGISTSSCWRRRKRR